MSKIDENIRSCILELKGQRDSVNQISSAMLNYLIGGFEAFENGQASSLDEAFSVEDVNLKKRRGRKPDLNKYSEVSEVLAFWVSSDKVEQVDSKFISDIASDHEVTEKFVSHVWDLISESIVMPPEELTSRRGIPISKDTWSAIVDGASKGLSRAIDEYKKSLKP